MAITKWTCLQRLPNLQVFQTVETTLPPREAQEALVGLSFLSELLLSSETWALPVLLGPMARGMGLEGVKRMSSLGTETP